MRSCLLALALSAAPAFGQADTTWVPPGSENWGTAANWSGGVVPSAATPRTVVFGSGTTGGRR